MPLARRPGPFEVAVLCAATVAGLALVASDNRPRSVAEAMPPLVQGSWEWALLVTGLVGLAGIYWPRSPLVGVAVELGALVLLGTSTLMYAIALYAISGAQALAAGSFVAAVGCASWWRAGQIIHDLRRLAQLRDTLGEESP